MSTTTTAARAAARKSGTGGGGVQSVRVLVLGDPKVGKSSFIHTFISRQFPAEVPSALIESVIPPERTADGKIEVTIVDSRRGDSVLDSNSGDEEVLTQKILHADAILALYDVSNLETLASLKDYWIDWIKHVNQERYCPVIVVAHKEDLVPIALTSDGSGQSPEQRREKQMLLELMNSYSMILTAYRCSSKNFSALSESRIDMVFHMATLFVTCPFNVLYDIDKCALTHDCRLALGHIFRIFDTDGDGYLSDIELGTIQEYCFENTMSPEDIKKWKRQIKQGDVGCLDGDKVTLKGFLSAMKQYLDVYQLQTPWTILRRFNYNDVLENKSASLRLRLRLSAPSFDLPPLADNSDQAYRLSPAAVEFLTKIIKNYKQLDLAMCSNETSLDTPSGGGGNSSNSSNSNVGGKEGYKALNVALSVLDEIYRISTPWARGKALYECGFEDNFKGSKGDVSSDNNNSDNNNSYNNNNNNNNNNNDNKNCRNDSSYSSYTDDHSIIKHYLVLSGFGENSFDIDLKNDNVSQWILHWHMLACYRPRQTRELLYRLGFVDRQEKDSNGLEDLGVVVKFNKAFDKKRKNNVVKCIVLGKDMNSKLDFFEKFMKVNIFSESSSPLPPPPTSSSPSSPSPSSPSPSSAGSGSPYFPSLRSNISDIFEDASAEEDGSVYVRDIAANYTAANLKTNILVGGSDGNLNHKGGYEVVINEDEDVFITSMISEKLFSEESPYHFVENHCSSTNVAIIIIDFSDFKASFEVAKSTNKLLTPTTPRLFIALYTEGKSEEYKEVAIYLNQKGYYILTALELQNFERMSMKAVWEKVLNIIENPTKGIPDRRNPLTRSLNPFSWSGSSSSSSSSSSASLSVLPLGITGVLGLGLGGLLVFNKEFSPLFRQITSGLDIWFPIRAFDKLARSSSLIVMQLMQHLGSYFLFSKNQSNS